MAFSNHAYFVRRTDFDWLSLQQRCIFFYKPWLYSQVSVVAMDFWFVVVVVVVSFINTKCMRWYNTNFVYCRRHGPNHLLN